MNNRSDGPHVRPVPSAFAATDLAHRFAICIPVRNEEALLPGCLDSIAALDLNGLPRPGIHIAFDTCTDRSEQIVADRVQAGYPFEITTVRLAAAATPNAGRARKAAMDAAACGTLGKAATHILTTDADSLVAQDWLRAHVAGFRHADVIAGLVRRINRCTEYRYKGLPPRDQLETYLERLHLLRRKIDPIEYDADPSHPYASGASIGITREAYCALDGLPRLPNAEDEAMIKRARLHGYRVRQDCSVQVRTSDRRDGRATAGLAAALRDLDNEDLRSAAMLVEDPRDAADHYRRQADSRAAFPWLRSEVDARHHARLTGEDGDRVVQAWQPATSADAFVMRLTPDVAPVSAIPLAEASVILQTLELSLDVQSRQAASL